MKQHCLGNKSLPRPAYLDIANFMIGTSWNMLQCPVHFTILNSFPGFLVPGHENATPFYKQKECAFENCILILIYFDCSPNLGCNLPTKPFGWCNFTTSNVRG